MRACPRGVRPRRTGRSGFVTFANGGATASPPRKLGRGTASLVRGEVIGRGDVGAAGVGAGGRSWREQRRPGAGAGGTGGRERSDPALGGHRDGPPSGGPSGRETAGGRRCRSLGRQMVQREQPLVRF